MKLATIAPSLSVYLANPNRYDWPNIDTPDAALIFSHKSKRAQAEDLAKAAHREPLEVWIKDTSESDLKGIDTPGSDKTKPKTKPKTHRFKVTKKSEAEKTRKETKAKEIKEVRELVKSEPNVVNMIEPTSRKLPSEQEILDRAQQLYMAENFKAVHNESMPETLPTKNELAEEGYLQTAKLDLMTSENTKASRQVFDYVDSLRGELEKIGYTVIPLEGFNVEDLKY